MESSKQAHRASVLVIAPGPGSQGGISAVVAMHRLGRVWDESNCAWLETMNGGGRFAKLATAVAAFGRCVVLLPRTRLVHIHMALGASLYRKFTFFSLARLFRKRTIVHVHCPNGQFTNVMRGGSTFRRWLFTAMLARADRVIALSDSWQRLILEHVPDARVMSLANPYWLPSDFHPAGRTGRTVLYLNRLEPRKGYGDLLRAIPAVLRCCPDARFVVAGHGEVAEARALASELGVSGSVEFPGWVEGARKWQVLAEADVLCLPSFQEGVPITLLEAMGAGLAVVTTRVGGIPDVVTDGVNGLLVREGDVTDIAFALARVLTDQALRQRLGQAGQHTVEATNAVAIVAASLARLYGEL